MQRRKRIRGSGRLLRAVAFAAAGMLCAAQAEAATRRVSAEEFRGHVARLQGLVSVCAAGAAGCDAAQVGDDEKVGDLAGEGKGGGGFEVHWGWLRDALTRARTAKPEDRATLMHDAGDHMDELAKQSGAAGSEAAFAKARTDADAVLARPEFQGAGTVTWWDLLKARAFSWLGRLFQGVNRLGEMAPWLGRLLEWVLFVGAAAGLLFFLLRSLDRQRRRVSLNEGTVKATAWDREGKDWAKEAEGYAAVGAWRDAVHCLYWASIVTLEARRSWRHNPTRTPREYVRLLKPGSAQQERLRGLTRIFETVWYGLRDAEAEEYGHARSLYEGLAAGSVDDAAVMPAAIAEVTA